MFSLAQLCLTRVLYQLKEIKVFKTQGNVNQDQMSIDFQEKNIKWEFESVWLPQKRSIRNRLFKGELDEFLGEVILYMLEISKVWAHRL